MKVLVGRRDGIYRLVDSNGTCVGSILLYNDIRGRPRARLSGPRGYRLELCEPISQQEWQEIRLLLPKADREKLPEKLS